MPPLVFSSTSSVGGSESSQWLTTSSPLHPESPPGVSAGSSPGNALDLPEPVVSSPPPSPPPPASPGNEPDLPAPPALSPPPPASSRNSPSLPPQGPSTPPTSLHKSPDLPPPSSPPFPASSPPTFSHTLSPASSPTLPPYSTPTPPPLHALLPPNTRPGLHLRITSLPPPLRQKILSETSISALLTLSKTHPTFRTDIQTSTTITDTVFNAVHDFRTSPHPPSVQKLLFADPYLHPLFAKAISESYDGADGLLEEEGTSAGYFLWLQQRCYVVHIIDQSFSRIQDEEVKKRGGKKKKREHNGTGVEGTKRKIILLQFWRLLDCLENWSISVSASLDAIKDGFQLTADDYFGWCVDFVKGFKHALLSDEERQDLSEVVGFFLEIHPARLIKGGHDGDEDRFWSFLGLKCVVLGFCLLGGLERVVGALYRNYGLAEMRGVGKEEGMERAMARGIGRWVEWERGRVEMRRRLAGFGRKGMPGRKTGPRREWSDDDDQDDENRVEDEDESMNENDENGDEDEDEGEGKDEGEEQIAEDIEDYNPRVIVKRRAIG
ncbi:hypothetical protein L873DRAFT_835128 [Choiromyces venosus 120613-1]|uniref:F-box domain-containing protein n=1 Tax=Choiromyces venosus 120613-1 TaxID=1336337 RepID=A0A3N4JPQ6_9PEZI|nr:hypothetical protein L873DRAFT_835128 [Choiromyces venosus 120613-1]